MSEQVEQTMTPEQLLTKIFEIVSAIQAKVLEAPEKSSEETPKSDSLEHCDITGAYRELIEAQYNVKADSAADLKQLQFLYKTLKSQPAEKGEKKKDHGIPTSPPPVFPTKKKTNAIPTTFNF